MTINTTAIANLLRPGLAAVFGDYPQYPSQWTEIFDQYESDKAVEVEQEMKLLGLAQITPEGSPFAMDSMGQRTTTNYNHKYVGLMVAITHQAMADSLYKTRFPNMAKELKASLAQTKEVLGASVLNNGFNPAYPIGDGQPLFSTAHPIDGGTVANTPAIPADLNEASLEAAIIALSQFKGVAGLLTNVKAKKLIVAPQNQFVVDRLLSSAFRTNTANNDTNAIYNMNAIPQGYRVNNYLSNPQAWFLMTDAPDGFKHYIRERITTSVYSDFNTNNLLAKAFERYSFGVSNWRAAYGSSGV